MVLLMAPGVVSRAGGPLLTRVLRITGLTAGRRWRRNGGGAQAAHGPGKIVADLAVALAAPAIAPVRPTCPAPPSDPGGLGQRQLS